MSAEITKAAADFAWVVLNNIPSERLDDPSVMLSGEGGSGWIVYASINGESGGCEVRKVFDLEELIFGFMETEGWERAEMENGIAGMKRILQRLESQYEEYTGEKLK